MPAVVADPLKQTMLGALNGSGTKFVGLFVNNVTPNGGTTYGAFTPPSDSAYAAQALGTPTYTNAAHVEQMAYPTVTFPAMSVDVNVYGYYVYDTGVFHLCWSEVFGSPPITIPAGVSFSLNLIMQDGDC